MHSEKQRPQSLLFDNGKVLGRRGWCAVVVNSYRVWFTGAAVFIYYEQVYCFAVLETALIEYKFNFVICPGQGNLQLFMPHFRRIPYVGFRQFHARQCAVNIHVVTVLKPCMRIVTWKLVRQKTYSLKP